MICRRWLERPISLFAAAAPGIGGGGSWGSRCSRAATPTRKKFSGPRPVSQGCERFRISSVGSTQTGSCNDLVERRTVRHFYILSHQGTEYRPSINGLDSLPRSTTPWKQQPRETSHHRACCSVVRVSGVAKWLGELVHPGSFAHVACTTERVESAFAVS